MYMPGLAFFEVGGAGGFFFDLDTTQELSSLNPSVDLSCHKYTQYKTIQYIMIYDFNYNICMYFS
jgi:hypothetical protein